MKYFNVGDKALINKGTRAKFYKDDKSAETYITKNLKKNEEVEIMKIEKAHKKVGGYAYFIKANVKGKELVSSHSIEQDRFLPKECREMLEEARRIKIELEEEKARGGK